FLMSVPFVIRRAVTRKLKTLMLYPEGPVPWYKAIRSPHRCELFFSVLGAVFPVHENKNNRFKFSSLQSSSAGESCRWVTMFGYESNHNSKALLTRFETTDIHPPLPGNSDRQR